MTNHTDLREALIEAIQSKAPEWDGGAGDGGYTDVYMIADIALDVIRNWSAEEPLTEVKPKEG